MISYRRFGLVALSTLALAACQHELGGGAGLTLTNAPPAAASGGQALTYSAAMRQFGAPTEAKFATGGNHFLTRHTDEAKRLHWIRL